MAGFYLDGGAVELNYDTDTPGFIEIAHFSEDDGERVYNYVELSELKDFVDTAVQADKDTK